MQLPHRHGAAERGHPLRLACDLGLPREFEDLIELDLHLGFSSHSHFTAAFQKVSRHTPSELRQAVPGG